MSDTTNTQDGPTYVTDPAQLQKALDFVYYVSTVVETVIDEIESTKLTQDKGHAILRRITADIRSELTDFPTTDFFELCSQCLPDFNNCHFAPATCMTNYSTCRHTCTQ